MNATALLEQQMSHAPTATFQPAQHLARQQIISVPKRSIRRALANGDPLGYGQLDLNFIQDVRGHAVGALRRPQSRYRPLEHPRMRPAIAQHRTSIATICQRFHVTAWKCLARQHGRMT